MPTKRTRTLPQRLEPKAASWVAAFIARCQAPDEDRDPEAWDAFLGWLFFRESAPGMPHRESDEGKALVRRYWDREARAR